MAAAVLLGVCTPASASADEFSELSASMLSSPEINLNSRLVRFYDEDGFGIEENEPVTPNSGSVCRRAGYVDPDAPYVEEVGIDWTLKSTEWFSFTGTGGPVVVTLDGKWLFGVVVYQADGVPTAFDALACAAAPARIELNTEAGRRYLIQAGDRKWFSQTVIGAYYILKLADAAPNVNRAHAAQVPFGVQVPMSNFGGELDSDTPSCSGGGATYLGGHGVWARVDVPSTGTLRFSLEPEEVELESAAMVQLFPRGATTPVDCVAGSFNAVKGSRSIELSRPVTAGDYWLHLMSAVESGAKPERSPEESMEEPWLVRADFAPDLDLDDDRYSRPGDCDDGNAAIHPDAVEVLDNGIDENCDGRDAKRDSDNDGVPDYKDRCPRRSNEGVDADGDGCRDPRQLPLTAQVRLTLSGGKLHVASLVVRTEQGARVTLTCTKQACEGESKRMRADRAQFGATFQPHIPDGTEILIAATKKGELGIAKRYRLSTSGTRLLRQWCTGFREGEKKVSCE